MLGWKDEVGEASCKFVSDADEDEEDEEELGDVRFPVRVPHKDMISESDRNVSQ